MVRRPGVATRSLKCCEKAPRLVRFQTRSKITVSQRVWRQSRAFNRGCGPVFTHSNPSAKTRICGRLASRLLNRRPELTIRRAAAEFSPVNANESQLARVGREPSTAKAAGSPQLKTDQAASDPEAARKGHGEEGQDGTKSMPFGGQAPSRINSPIIGNSDPPAAPPRKTKESSISPTG